MLEAVVQQVNRRAELMFGQPPGQVAVGSATRIGDAGKLACQHERLVAGTRQVGANPVRPAHHDHALVWAGAGVAAGQDRRALAERHEQPRERRDERGLAAAANRKIADADHRPAQPAPQVGPARVALTTPARRCRVEIAEDVESARLVGQQNEETRSAPAPFSAPPGRAARRQTTRRAGARPGPRGSCRARRGWPRPAPAPLRRGWHGAPDRRAANQRGARDRARRESESPRRCRGRPGQSRRNSPCAGQTRLACRTRRAPGYCGLQHRPGCRRRTRRWRSGRAGRARRCCRG